MPASPYSSVQQARQILAARLVELQKDAGIRTSRKMAERLGWQESKVSRIVNAVTPPSEQDVTAWCAACDAPGEAAGLISALRLAAGAYVEWRRMERHGLRASQEAVAPLYERTRLFRFYSSCVLPGLAQTAGYTEAVLRNVQIRRGLADDLDEAVQVRMDRQRILDDLNRSFVFVLEEPVLRSIVGDEAMMAEQLGHLLRLATRPNVRLGIVPWTRRRAQPPADLDGVLASQSARAAAAGSDLATALLSRTISLHSPTDNIVRGLRACGISLCVAHGCLGSCQCLKDLAEDTALPQLQNVIDEAVDRFFVVPPDVHTTGNQSG